MSVLVHANFPSLTAVFMAAAAAVLVLLIARILFLLMRLWSSSIVRPGVQEKDGSLLSLLSVNKPWPRPVQWNTLPASLPFALALSEKPSRGVGNGIRISLSQKPSHALPVNWKLRTAPQFQPPPPALYESPVPLSMAKMIMSRHTFRKPNPNRSRRPSTSSSPSQPTSSPPQTPSRLYHSIA